MCLNKLTKSTFKDDESVVCYKVFSVGWSRRHFFPFTNRRSHGFYLWGGKRLSDRKKRVIGVESLDSQRRYQLYETGYHCCSTLSGAKRFREWVSDEDSPIWKVRLSRLTATGYQKIGLKTISVCVGRRMTIIERAW